VRVEGNRIAEVTPGAATPPVAGATAIDGAGATLMPGLIESHAHLGLADVGSHDLTRIPPEENMLITVRFVKAGALADLLLVDGDPLADIGILQDRDALRMIMKDGVLHKAPPV
jgi:imidazolonepropionase-like amidohydrolase